MQDATTPTPHARRTSRTRTLLLCGVALLAIVASLALVNALATRFARRIDVTSTGAMALAPRTTKLLTTMEGEHRLIVATDLRSADTRAVQHLRDVLAEVEATASRSSSPFRSAILDTSSANGVRDFESLIADLLARDKAPLDDALAAFADIASAGAALASDLDTTARRSWSELQAASTTAAPATRAFLDQGATILDVRTRELRDASAEARAVLSPPDGALAPRVFIPPTDQSAKALVTKLAPASSDVASLASQLRRLLQDASITPQAARSIQTAIAAMEEWSTRAQNLLQRIRGTPQPEVVRLANALKAGQAAVLLGPPGKGLVAIDLEQLLPSSLWIDAAQASQTDMKRRVEELLATALASLRAAHRPIVVIMHAEQRPFLSETPIIDALRQRLSMRGVDVLEWAIITMPSPEITAIDPQRERPVVYVALSPDSAAARPMQGGLSGAERAAKLAETLRTLFEQRANVAVSLAPSVMPTYGEKDPIASALTLRGVEAATGTPLLTQAATKQGTYAETDRVLQASTGAASPHPLTESVRGLPTYFTWCIPLKASASGEWQTAAIYRITSDAATWGEGQWLQLRQTPREARSIMPQQPNFDEGRDVRLASGEAWPVVMSSQGPTADSPRTLIVGSNDWFIDAVTQQAASIDGRATLAYPGNLELFESSVWWLAHQDDLIAQSATARAVAIVKPIEPGALRSLRLALILGLPALILVLGALYRVVRGG